MVGVHLLSRAVKGARVSLWLSCNGMHLPWSFVAVQPITVVHVGPTALQALEPIQSTQCRVQQYSPCGPRRWGRMRIRFFDAVHGAFNGFIILCCCGSTFAGYWSAAQVNALHRDAPWGRCIACANKERCNRQKPQEDVEFCYPEKHRKEHLHCCMGRQNPDARCEPPAAPATASLRSCSTTAFGQE
jgi:hypothetical protein